MKSKQLLKMSIRCDLAWVTPRRRSAVLHGNDKEKKKLVVDDKEAVMSK